MSIKSFPKIKICFKCIQNPSSVFMIYIFTSPCSCNWPFLRASLFKLQHCLLWFISVYWNMTCKVSWIWQGLCRHQWQARSLRVLKRNLGVWTGADNETVWIPCGTRCGKKCLTPTSPFSLVWLQCHFIV